MENEKIDYELTSDDIRQMIEMRIQGFTASVLSKTFRTTTKIVKFHTQYYYLKKYRPKAVEYTNRWRKKNPERTKQIARMYHYKNQDRVNYLHKLGYAKRKDETNKILRERYANDIDYRKRIKLLAKKCRERRKLDPIRIAKHRKKDAERIRRRYARKRSEGLVRKNNKWVKLCYRN